MVDQIFDAVDSKVDAHADEANALIATACTQIRDLMQQDGGKVHAVQILGVLRNLTKELQPKGLELKQMANEGVAAAKAKIRDSLNKRFDFFAAYCRYSWAEYFPSSRLEES